MMKTRGVTVPNETAMFLLNTAYTVFLGIFVQFLFRIDVDTNGGPQVQLLLNSANWPCLLLLISYFMLDWFSANITIPSVDRVSHHILMFLLTFVALLGVAMILAISPNQHSYALLSSYALAVTFWDVYLFILRRPSTTDDTSWANMLFLTMLTLRLVVALVMISVTLMFWAWRHPNDTSSIASGFHMMLGFYLAMKFFRYVLFCFCGVLGHHVS